MRGPPKSDRLEAKVESGFSGLSTFGSPAKRSVEADEEHGGLPVPVEGQTAPAGVRPGGDRGGSRRFVPGHRGVEGPEALPTAGPSRGRGRPRAAPGRQGGGQRRTHGRAGDGRCRRLPPLRAHNPVIAEFARVVNYDRAGIGWSEPGPAPRDAYTIARELHTALKNAGLLGPYVPVGASMGGPFALAFAGLYPEETAGVVLADSMHPDQWERLPARLGRVIRVADRLMPLLPLLARFGLLRLFDTTRHINLGLSEQQRLAPGSQARLRAVFALPKHWKATYDETTIWETTREQVRASWDLGEKPLLVLSATRNETFPDMMGPWLEMQAELASLSSNSGHHLVDGASHVALFTDPRYLREVAEKIREFIDTDLARQRGGLEA